MVFFATLLLTTLLDRRRLRRQLNDLINSNVLGSWRIDLTGGVTVSRIATLTFSFLTFSFCAFASDLGRGDDGDGFVRIYDAKYLQDGGDFTCTKENTDVRAITNKNPEPGKKMPGLPGDKDLPSLPEWDYSIDGWWSLANRKANVTVVRKSGVPTVTFKFLDGNKATQVVTYSKCEDGSYKNLFDSQGRLVRYGTPGAVDDVYAHLVDCSVVSSISGKSPLSVTKETRNYAYFHFSGYAVDWEQKSYVSFNTKPLGVGDVSANFAWHDDKQDRIVRVTFSAGVFGSDGFKCKYNQ